MLSSSPSETELLNRDGRALDLVSTSIGPWGRTRGRGRAGVEDEVSNQLQHELDRIKVCANAHGSTERCNADGNAECNGALSHKEEQDY